MTRPRDFMGLGGVPAGNQSAAPAQTAPTNGLLALFDRWWVVRRQGGRPPHGSDVWPAYRDGHGAGYHAATERFMDLALAVRSWRRTGNDTPLMEVAHALEKHAPPVPGETNVEHAQRCIRCLMDGRQGRVELRND